MLQHGTWHGGEPRSRLHCAIWDPAPLPPKETNASNFRPISIVAKRLDASSPLAPLPKRTDTLIFGSRLLWLNDCMNFKMPLGTKVNLGPGDVVLDAVAAPLPKRGTAPQFSVHIYCGQTAGWMKTSLGIEVDLGPCHVLDGDPAITRKGHGSPLPLFGPCLLLARSPISAIAELLLHCSP